MPENTLFPKEVTSHVPRMTLTGQELLHVEQHQGLLAYQPEEIRFRTSVGMLIVTGQSLRFRMYSAGEAIISGEIDGISVQSAGGRA